MRTILTTALLALSLFATAPQASAFGFGMRGPGFGPPHGGPDGPGGPAGPPLRLLLSQMTADQRRQVRQILVADRQERRTTVEQLHAAHEALADKMLAAGPLTEADLAPDIQKIAALHQQLLAHGTKVMLQVRAIATPEQLAKVAQTKQQLDSLRGQIDALLGRPGTDDEPAE